MMRFSLHWHLECKANSATTKLRPRAGFGNCPIPCSSSDFAGEGARATFTLRGLENLLLNLRYQAVELRYIQAKGVLAVACFFAGDVPIGHPAELLAFRRLQHDHKRIKRDLFLFSSQPRFQLFRQESRDYFEISVAGSQLEVEIEMQFPNSAARGTWFGRLFRELVEGVEEFVVRGILLMTLSAVKILCCHV